MRGDRITVDGVDDTSTLRTRSEIEERYAALEKEIASEAEWSAEGGYTAPTYKDRLAGHLVTFQWILFGGPAPFTSKTSDGRALWQEGDLPSELAIMWEKRAVLDELFPGHAVSDPRPSGRTKSWLHAVELTIDWALGRDDRNPLTAL
jgi:hypothetical protein